MKKIMCLLLLLGNVQVQAEIMKQTEHSGLFAVYADNREQGIANYITADFLLLTYSMLRAAQLKDLEKQKVTPLLQTILRGLSKQLVNPSSKAGKANQDFITILLTLLQPQTNQATSQRAADELALILAADGIKKSPLWGIMLDYSQFKPRGYYTDSAAKKRYFRTQRYANSVLLALQASAATGVTPELAQRMSLQIQQLAQLLNKPPLVAAYQQLNQLLQWQFGAADDVRFSDLQALMAKKPSQWQAALLEYAKAEKRQPKIIAGMVDYSKLLSNQTAADVMLGWRLLPSRYSADTAAFQALVFDQVKRYQGQCKTRPMSLTQINGQPVKGFPLANELMALLGNASATVQLQSRCETAYEGYAAAKQQASARLDQATGLNQQHLALLKTLNQPQHLTTAKAFWTWQRYISVLYAKQSYTLMGKSLSLPQPRPGASIEPALKVYQALDQLVKAHQQQTPDLRWDEFSMVLQQMIQIAKKVKRAKVLNEDDEILLNGLDKSLKALVGDNDQPIVVDVHTNPASQEVLQQATGYPLWVKTSKNRGARFSHYEFKQPLANRLTVDQWRQQLSHKGDH